MQSLAAGNAWVWQDVGSRHALFGIYYSNLTAPDAAVNARYNATFSCVAGDAACAALREAMQWYYRALFEKDSKVLCQFSANFLRFF